MVQKDIGEIQQIIDGFKEKGKRTKTNYYYTYQNFSDSFDVWEGTATIVFGIKEGMVYRVFYCSQNEEELGECLKQVPEGAVLEFITKEKVINENFLARAGFELYDTYGRLGRSLLGYEEEKERMKMQRMGCFYDDSYGEIATKHDLSELQKVIYGTFDVKADHLLTDKEMLELIEKNQVIIQRECGKICCIFIYKIQGKKIYYNLSLNRSTADVLYSIQQKELLKAIREKGVIYMYGWISLNNKAAVKRNENISIDKYNYIFLKA